MAQLDASFGARLRRLRELRGYSLRELARRAQVDSTYLSRVESGTYKPPKVQTIHRLADALALTPTEEGELIEVAGHLPAGLIRTTHPQSVVSASSPHHLRQREHDAVTARQLGRVGEARSILEREVIPVLRHRGPSIEFAGALTALGDVARAQRNYAEAEDVLLSAKGVLAEVLAATAERRNDAALIYDAQVGWALTKISLDIGNVRLARQRIDYAWQTLDQLRGSNEPGLTPARVICAQVMGRVYWAEGKISAARTWFDRSLALPQTGVRSHTQAETKMYRLLLLVEYRESFELTTAALVQTALDALAAGEEGPFPHVVAVVEGVLTRLYKSAGQTRKARAHYRQALQYKTDDRVRLAYPDFFDLYQREMAAAA